MTNNEIDKLISMLDTKDLAYIKKYLLNEKRKNINSFRQKTFENYLTTNKTFITATTMPRLYTSDSEQMFTNGVSIYIINSKFFNTKTKKLIAKKGSKFEIKEKNDFDTYLNRVLSKYKTIDSECIDLWEIDNTKYTSVEYFNNIDNHLHEDLFYTEEIDIANILLDNPKYKNSHNSPILKAESKIGKCYILGLKKR